MSLGRRLSEVVAIAVLALAAGGLTEGCKPLNGGLGGKCNLNCPRGSTKAFCQTIDDACDAEPEGACVGVIASGGTCSRPCMRDDDCREAVVPMMCSPSDCPGPKRICVRAADLLQFCGPGPRISCVDLHLRGDGICDGPTGTNHCADDAADCAGQQPWAATCAASCAEVRTRACPLDDLSGCEESCVKTITDNVTCRPEAKAYLECDTGPGARVCGADQKSQLTGLCDAQKKAFDDCAGTTSSAF